LLEAASFVFTGFAGLGEMHGGYPEDGFKINICLDPRIGLDGTEEAVKG
jgi:hypothetical protein